MVHPSQPDQWADYDRFQLKPALYEYYRSINHNNMAAIKSLGMGKFDLALDLAAGCGTSTLPLLEVAKAVIGVDSSSQLIEIARNRNTSPNITFICEQVEKFCPQEPVDLVCASWLLNYFHSEADLRAIIEKIYSILKPDGCFSMVVPSAAFFSSQVQRIARELYEFEVAQLADNGSSSIGIFSYANEWIKTTVWQPLHLMRFCGPWFELREWDVKGTLVRDNLLPSLNVEPPYTVLYGKKRGAFK